MAVITQVSVSIGSKKQPHKTKASQWARAVRLIHHPKATKASRHRLRTSLVQAWAE